MPPFRRAYHAEAKAPAREAKPHTHINMRLSALVGGATVALAAAGYCYVLRRRVLSARVRLAVLNPCDASSIYNKNVMKMLHELLKAIGATNVVLTEIDVKNRSPSEVDAAIAGDYHGFIIPGSAAGAYEKDAWIVALAATIMKLHKQRRKMFGICFGHQIIAHALGGKVEKNAKHGVHAGTCAFDFTPLGASVFDQGDAATGALHYHHGDIVTRLPSSAALLGCSATNPSHAFAVFGAATAARTAVTRASIAASSTSDNRPHGLTLQAHPEFATETGRAVLRALIADPSETPAPAGCNAEEWRAERLRSVDDKRADAHSLEMTRTAVRLLWPTACS